MLGVVIAIEHFLAMSCFLYLGVKPTSEIVLSVFLPIT
jgi:hypothetical protein